MRSLLHGVADLVVFHPRAARRGIACLLGAAAIATAWGARNLQTDYLSLLPRNKPEVKVFRETIRDFGSLDYLLLLVTAPQGHLSEDYEEAVEALAAAIRESPHVAAVEYKLDTDSPLVDFMASRALLFLDQDEREELERRLSDDAIREQVKRDHQILMTPSSGAVKRFIQLDPLGLLSLVKGHFEAARSTGIDFSQGYYLSRDKTAVLLIIKPVKPAQDVSFDVKLMKDLRARCAGALGKPSDLPPPTLDFGGGYVVALEDYNILKRDAAVNISSSFLTVLALFALGMGHARAIKYAAYPLAAGILVTGGFGALALGSFNPATAGFAALLVGLAVDYIIVMYGRFWDERHEGIPAPEAARTIIVKTGRSVFLGAITTAATFLALCIVDFKGLRDLGLLTGVGIMLCFLTVIVMVPLMLLGDAEARSGMSGRPLRSFGVERMALFPRRYPRAVALICLLSAALCAFLVPRVGFDDNLKALRARGNRGIEVQRLVANKFGGGFDYLMVITHARDLDELLVRNQEVNVDLDQLVARGVLSAYDSVVKYLPSRRVQDENLAWLRQKRASSLDPKRVRATFLAALKESGFRHEAFDKALDRVVKALEVDERLDPGILRKNRLGFIVDRYLREEPAGMKSVTYAFPAQGDFKRHVPPDLARLARERKVELSGVTVISQALRGAIRFQAYEALAFGLVLVLALVYWDFRDVKLSLIVMAPLCVGVLWMCGLMILLGLTFNFFNVFVATMILGIGVDYGIHATHRYLEGGRRDFDDAFFRTGKGIVLAALTTMLGFGSFATSHYRGLYSLGMVAIIGTAACLVACFTVLPGLLLWAYPPRVSAPAGGGATPRDT